MSASNSGAADNAREAAERLEKAHEEIDRATWPAEDRPFLDAWLAQAAGARQAMMDFANRFYGLLSPTGAGGPGYDRDRLLKLQADADNAAAALLEDALAELAARAGTQPQS